MHFSSNIMADIRQECAICNNVCSVGHVLCDMCMTRPSYNSTDETMMSNNQHTCAICNNQCDRVLSLCYLCRDQYLRQYTIGRIVRSRMAPISK